MAKKPKRGKSGKSRRAAPTYKSYRFIDKCHSIDAFAAARSESKLSIKAVADASGVSAGTIRGWEYGGVRRPQFPTMWAAAKGMGYNVIRERSGKPVFDKE